MGPRYRAPRNPTRSQTSRAKTVQTWHYILGKQLTALNDINALRARGSVYCSSRVGVRRHHVRGPEPRRQRQFRPMHHRAGGQRGLPAAIETFEKPRAALQSDSAPLAARGTDKPLRPAPRKQKCRATRLVGKLLLKLRERPPTRHRSCFPATAPPQTRLRSDTTSSGT